MRYGPRLVMAILLVAASALAAACGQADPKPLALVEGALAQQYFETHHAIPSNRVDRQIGQEAQGLVRRIDALPPPVATTHPQLDVHRVQTTHGAAGVVEALFAAYITHFGGPPTPPQRARIAAWIGASPQLPLPVVAHHRD